MPVEEARTKPVVFGSNSWPGKFGSPPPVRSNGLQLLTQRDQSAIFASGFGAAAFCFNQFGVAVVADQAAH